MVPGNEKERCSRCLSSDCYKKISNGWFIQQNFIFYSSRPAGKSRIKMLADLVPVPA